MTRRPATVVAVIATIFAVTCTGTPEPQPTDRPIPHSSSVTLPAAITCLTVLNGSAIVAAGMADGRIAVWNGRDPASLVVVTAHAARVLAVGSTSDGSEVWSVAADESLARTAIAPGETAASQRLELGAAPTRAAVFSADGSTLVTGAEFGEIRVFDTTSAALRQTLHGHRTELQSLAVRPGSAIVASASAEADLRIWDAAAGREIGLVDGDLSLFALGFSPRDGTLASGGVNRRLTLYDSTTFTPAGELALKAPRMVATLAWSPDGRFIAVGDLDDETLSKGGIEIVDAASRAVVATLETGGTPAAGLTFTERGSVVAILGRDLRAWTVETIR